MTTTGRRALLLDGRTHDDATLALLHDALLEGLGADGWVVDDWPLREAHIAWCSGCFGCWTKTPGVCVHIDAGREAAARAAHADLRVYLTPVTFGGYSAELKKALDHLIPLLLPLLKGSGADTRHPQRYARAHDLLVVGTVPPGCGDGAEAQTFRKLVQRNILNLRPGRWAAGVVEEGAGEWEVRVEAAALLAKVGVRPAEAAPAPSTREAVA